MPALHLYTPQPTAPVTPFSRGKPDTRLRMCLASGRAVGTALRLPYGVAPATALARACDLAHRTGQLVSLAAAGPFPALPALAATAIAGAAVPPEHIELTVSDPVLHDAGVEALVVLSALRDKGIGIALRGFGRGSISIVPRLPLSAVILAASAIRDVPGDPAATLLLHTLLGLARSQGLRVIATGIETEAQRALLSGIGCHAGEGSLFGTLGPAEPDG